MQRWQLLFKLNEHKIKSIHVHPLQWDELNIVVFSQAGNYFEIVTGSNAIPSVGCSHVDTQYFDVNSPRVDY